MGCVGACGVRGCVWVRVGGDVWEGTCGWGRVGGDVWGGDVGGVGAWGQRSHYPCHFEPRRRRFCIIDDYYSFEECARAVDEYRAEHAIKAPLVRIDSASVYWRA